ncbi:MAG: S8 family serine peptidase, partial [Candidatus Korarchaeota archaeon]|nr:S8 family serine peptidase [Candidatus Korarchaeota archaeon]
MSKNKVNLRSKAFMLVCFILVTSILPSTIIRQGVRQGGNENDPNVINDAEMRLQASISSGTVTTQSESQTVPWGIDKINAIKAAGTVNVSSIDIAVIDSGVDDDHDDLQDEDLRDTIWEYDAIKNTTENVSGGTGHGTHCAGIIGAL